MTLNVVQHKTVKLLKTFFFFFAYHFSLVFVYLTCGPLFQGGPEMPKVWKPLGSQPIFITIHWKLDSP